MTVAGPRATVRLCGPIDGEQGDAMGRELSTLIEAGYRRLAVDVSRVPSITSAGAAPLISTLSALRLCGGTLSVLKANTQISAVLTRMEITALIELTRVEDDPGSA